MNPFKSSLFGLFGLLLAQALSTPEADAYILCRRETDIIAANPSTLSSGDSCTGTVILQGISYQCGPRSQVEAKRAQFLEELRTSGEAFCSQYCAKRGWPWNRCNGHFSPPQQCGFTVPVDISEAYGRTIASCDPACGGTAFAYCSIYRSSMLQVVPAMLEGAVPNCSCRRGE